MVDVEVYMFDGKNYIVFDKIQDYVYLANEKNTRDMMIRKIDNNDDHALLSLESDEEFEKALMLLTTKKLQEEEEQKFSFS